MPSSKLLVVLYPFVFFLNPRYFPPYSEELKSRPFPPDLVVQLILGPSKRVNILAAHNQLTFLNGPSQDALCNRKLISKIKQLVGKSLCL